MSEIQTVWKLDAIRISSDFKIPLDLTICKRQNVSVIKAAIILEETEVAPKNYSECLKLEQKMVRFSTSSDFRPSGRSFFLVLKAVQNKNVIINQLIILAFLKMADLVLSIRRSDPDPIILVKWCFH